MVLRQLLEPVVADEVGARVADVADPDDLAVDQRHGHRRPHARGGLVRAGPLVDAPVRVLDQRHDVRLVIGAVPVGVLQRAGREL